MSSRHPLPRSHPGRLVRRWSQPLPVLTDARDDFVFFADKNKAWLPMLTLYDQLVLSGGEDLFGSAIMGGGLVLATRSDVAHDEGVIVVEFDPNKSAFLLCYRNREVAPDQSEQVEVAEVWERLRLFVAYKFGVRLRKTNSFRSEVRQK